MLRTKPVILVPVLAMAMSWFSVVCAGMTGRVSDNDLQVALTDSVDDYAIDSIINAINLDEVVVTAKVKPIVINGDTTIVSADAFRLGEDEQLEELVSRVPGLEYDRSSQSLKYRGKRLSEILVNGEKFFGSDIVTALENLPADLIEKLKIYDKTTDENRFKGLGRSGTNYVLDLETKKRFDGMLAAMAQAQAGNERKRQAEVSANYFRIGGDNLSVRLSSGNENSQTRYKDNRLDNIGLSVNKKVAKDVAVNGNFSYRHGIEGSEVSMYSERYMTGGNNYSYSGSERVGRSRTLDFNISMHGALDSMTYLSVNGSVASNGSRDLSDSHDASYSGDPGLDTADPFGDPLYENVAKDLRINDNLNESRSSNRRKNYSASGNVIRHLDKGRKTSLSISTSISNGRGNGESFMRSKITYYQLQSLLGGDSLMLRNQYGKSPTRTNNWRVGVGLSRVLKKNLTLEANYNFKISRERSVRSTYDLAPFSEDDTPSGYLPEGYEAGYIDSLSNYQRSRTLSHEMRVELNYHDWAAEAGLNEVGIGLRVRPERRWLDRKSSLLTADTVRSAVNIAPEVRIGAVFKEWRFSFRYEGESQQPSLSDLMSMTDNRNPLYITHGNPDLNSGYRQSAYFNVQWKTFSGRINFRNSYNDITQAVIYNQETGGTVSYPVNIDGNWGLDGAVDFFKFLDKGISSWIVNAAVNGSRSQSVSLLNDNMSDKAERSVTQSNMCSFSSGVRYSMKWCSLYATFDWIYSHSKNRLRGTEDRMRNYGVRLNAEFSLPFSVKVGSDVRYSFRNGAGLDGRSDEQFVWNMSASWSFMKWKRMSLTAEWNDILNDKKSIFRNVTSTGLNEARMMQIGGYFMVGLRYRFSSQGGGRADPVIVY